jgi:hypothetical protein
MQVGLRRGGLQHVAFVAMFTALTLETKTL